MAASERLRRRPARLAAAVLTLWLAPAAAVPAQHDEAATADRPGPAEAILANLRDPGLQELTREVLERNPGLAGAEVRARAAQQLAPQAKALPEPTLGATAFVAPPETRVGPQRWSATLSLRFPWFGTVGLREQAAVEAAAVQEAQVAALRLELVTETRRLYYEIAFLDSYDAVVRADRDTLVHYEQLARTRYASGVGLQQAVIKLQAEITRDDNRLLDVRVRRATLVAAVNALRDRPQETVIPVVALPRFAALAVDPVALRARALALRPELTSADHGIAQAETMVELARKQYKPDFTLGATYTDVGPRSDPAGVALPPPDNGSDVFALSLGVSLPIKRGRLAAGVAEAADREQSARELKRAVVTTIDRSLGELVERTRTTWDQLRLLEDVLDVQADQSLRSAESGYAAGAIGSLDLLDAERMLLEVRTAMERARADYAVAIARLEGAVGEPLASRLTEGASQ